MLHALLLTKPASIFAYLSLCMFVYMYIHINTYTYTHAYIHTRTQKRTYTHAHKTHMHIYVRAIVFALHHNDVVCSACAPLAVAGFGNGRRERAARSWTERMTEGKFEKKKQVGGIVAGINVAALRCACSPKKRFLLNSLK